MAIAVECPECGERFSVPDAYAGKRGKCRRCGAGFRAEPADEFGFSASGSGHRSVASGNGFGGLSSAGASVATSRGAKKPSARGGYVKQPWMPAWGWGAIGIMLLATGGAFAAAWKSLPDADALRSEAKERAEKAKSAQKELTRDVKKKIVALEDEVSPLEKKVGEIAREKTIEDDVMPAIVKVHNMRGGQPAGTGTGWFTKVDDKLLCVTNHHVVNQASSLVIELQDGSKHDIEGFIADSVDWDLCILKPKFEIPKAKWLHIRPNDGSIRTGDTVYAAGNPGAHRHTITKGIVTRNVSMKQVTAEGAQTDYPWTVNPNQDIMWIEHDARIWPGNSGGPLMNDRFEVIGVNTRGMMAIMQRPSRLRSRGIRMVPTFGLASNSMYILEMIDKNKAGPVKPCSELGVMDMH